MFDGPQDAHEFLSLLLMTFLEAAMDATAQGMMDTFFGELAATGLWHWSTAPRADLVTGS